MINDLGGLFGRIGITVVFFAVVILAAPWIVKYIGKYFDWVMDRQ